MKKIISLFSKIIFEKIFCKMDSKNKWSPTWGNFDFLGSTTASYLGTVWSIEDFSGPSSETDWAFVVACAKTSGLVYLY